MPICTDDHIAISNLMFAYARCADRKDYAGFAQVFCEDAVFVYLGSPVTPLSGIQEMMQALEKYSRTLHQVSNVMYELEPDGSGDGDALGQRANGETYCIASHLYVEEGQDTKIEMGIIYHDELLRTRDGWRIQRREFDLLWSTTVPVTVP